MNKVTPPQAPLCGCLLYTCLVILGAVSFAISILQMRKRKIREWEQLVDGHTACKRGKLRVNLNFLSLSSVCFGFVPCSLSSNPLWTGSAIPGEKKARQETSCLHYFHSGPQSQGTNGVSLHSSPEPMSPPGRNANQLVEHTRPEGQAATQVISYNDPIWPGLETGLPSPSSVQTHIAGLKYLSNTNTFLPLSLLLIPSRLAPHTSLRAIRVHPPWMVIRHQSPDPSLCIAMLL